MPQIDLVETLIRCGSGSGSGGGDSKVSCETLTPSSKPGPGSDPNLPPDSICIPIQDSDIIHYARGDLERDNSAKESTNPKSQSHPNPSSNLHFTSNSQRTNLKANGPILGLPNRIKHVTCTASHHHRPPTTNSRIFPKKKSAPASGFEPSSPKVSCIGKVLSDRERGTCRQRRSRESLGCWKGFSALFSCGGNEEAVVEDLEEREAGVTRKDIPLRKRNLPAAAAGVPGLGGMKRFASGRRAASWGGDVELGAEVDGHVAVDLGRRSLDGNGVGPIAV